ncbi:hypothetical protein BH10ACI3_BH10ACI3_23200 [soil metagenome]
MNTFNLEPQRGASIMELLIVLVISSIIVTFALSQFGGAKSNLLRQNFAREFKTSLERARFDSVKRRAMDDTSFASVVITSPISYEVTTDLNQNGTIESTESRQVAMTNQWGLRILLAAGIALPVTISFDRRGQAIVEDYNGLATYRFLFCETGVSDATANNSNSTAIYLSATGTVAMTGGGDTIAAISNPSVSNIAGTSGVNPDVDVWMGPFPNPSPTPAQSASPTATTTATPPPTSTPTPVATPTAGPTGSTTPSTTPTAYPTPIPTATPLVSCLRGQRPGNPAECQCNSPWFLAKNGKCGP